MYIYVKVYPLKLFPYGLGVRISFKPMNWSSYCYYQFLI